MIAIKIGIDYSSLKTHPIINSIPTTQKYVVQNIFAYYIGCVGKSSG